MGESIAKQFRPKIKYLNFASVKYAAYNRARTTRQLQLIVRNGEGYVIIPFHHYNKATVASGYNMVVEGVPAKGTPHGRPKKPTNFDYEIV